MHPLRVHLEMTLAIGHVLTVITWVLRPIFRMIVLNVLPQIDLLGRSKTAELTGKLFLNVRVHIQLVIFKLLLYVRFIFAFVAFEGVAHVLPHDMIFKLGFKRVNCITLGTGELDGVGRGVGPCHVHLHMTLTEGLVGTFATGQSRQAAVLQSYVVVHVVAGTLVFTVWTRNNGDIYMHPLFVSRQSRFPSTDMRTLITVEGFISVSTGVMLCKVVSGERFMALGAFYRGMLIPDVSF